MDLRQLAEDIRYHGSPYSFNIFQERDLTGAGANYFGAGIYDSNLKPTAIDFAGDKGYVYAIKTPKGSSYLDFQKQLNQQSPEVIQILKENNLYNPDTLGADLYENLVNERVQGGMNKDLARRSVSNELRMYGIKGNTFGSNVDGLPSERVQVTYFPEDVTIVGKQSVTQAKQPALKTSAKNIVKQGIKGASKVVPIVGTITTLADIASQLNQPVAPGSLPIDYRMQTSSPWEQQQLNNVLNYFGR